MSAVEKTLRRLIIIGIFALAFIPLVAPYTGFPNIFPNSDALFFPYITGKNFTFRIVVEVIAGAWLALALCFPRYRPRRSWILGCFAIFVVVMAIADAQGVLPFKSFWSNFERMDGWITIAHTLLALVVAACVLDTEDLWRRFFHWSLGVSAFISVLGLLQVAGILTLGSGGTGLEARVDATFGNPIYLAVYMLFHVFLAALLWYQSWHKRDRGDRVAPSILYAVIMLLDTVTLLFSGTRGATLGLIGGGVLALLLYAFSADATQRMRRASVIAVVTVALLGGVLWLARGSAFVQDVGFLSRLSSISLSDDTTHARLLNMGIAWQGVKERPLLGWGQENYAIVFDKYYDPRMYAQEQWFDRVHNVIFDWWIAGGTLGLLAYLSIFAASLWALWRPSGERGSTEAITSHVKKRAAFSAAERAILTGLLAGYTIHNLTVFDNITSYILFAMVLGYITYRDVSARKAHTIPARALLPQSALPVVAAIAALLVWGTAWYVNAAALAQNTDISESLVPQPGLTPNIDLFEKAISVGSYGTQEAREQLSQFAARVIGVQAPDSVKTQFVQASVKELDLQEAVSPLDARFPLFAGGLLTSSGDYQNAQAELLRAQSLSPKKQTILFALAENAQGEKDAIAELSYLKQAYELDTDNLDARLYYAAALIGTGQDAAAQQLLAPVTASGEAADPRITQAYLARKEYAPLITIWQAAIAASPSSLQNYSTLAAIYYLAGNRPAAIATLQVAEKIDPSIMVQAETFIKQIQAGTLNLTQ